MAIDKVFTGSSEYNLAGNANLCIFFKANRRLLFISIVEDYCYACLSNTCLSAFIYEVLQFVSFLFVSLSTKMFYL